MKTLKTAQDELISRGFLNVHVCKRGVDTEMFKPHRHEANMRDRLSNGQPEKILLLYVGRLAAEKEIEKIKVVLQESNQFVLALVGDGPNRQALEKHFEGTQTVFTGFLHGEELAKRHLPLQTFFISFHN